MARAPGGLAAATAAAAQAGVHGTLAAGTGVDPARGLFDATRTHRCDLLVAATAARTAARAASQRTPP